MIPILERFNSTVLQMYSDDGDDDIIGNTYGICTDNDS